jgi:rfaE bifunctional protein kinase chain/domain
MLKRHDEILRQLSRLRVLTIGDLMLDRYVIGRVRRISPEAPVPVVEVERTFDRPGGAGNVAANVRALGAAVELVGVVGVDPEGSRLLDILSDVDVRSERILRNDSRPTTIKTRIMAQGQQIVRFDRESISSSSSVESAVLANLGTLDAVDAVILSDYAKGVLGPRVCLEVIQRCRARRIPVVVDPKGINYVRYSGATAITPNQAEAAQAIGLDSQATLHLESLRRFFLSELSIGAGLITRGEVGMTLLLPDSPPMDLRATARDVSDVTGAGDTVVSAFTLCLASGASFVEAAFIANVAAGVAVSKAGAATITVDELRDALQTQEIRPGRRAR